MVPWSYTLQRAKRGHLVPCSLSSTSGHRNAEKDGCRDRATLQRLARS